MLGTHAGWSWGEGVLWFILLRTPNNLGLPLLLR